MIHRTYRSLDRPPKLVGFTLGQWGLLILDVAATFGLVHVTDMPARPAISLAVFLVGLPAALTYVSEAGGLKLGVLLREMVVWCARRGVLAESQPDRGRACGVLVQAERARGTFWRGERP